MHASTFVFGAAWVESRAICCLGVVELWQSVLPSGISIHVTMLPMLPASLLSLYMGLHLLGSALFVFELFSATLGLLLPLLLLLLLVLLLFMLCLVVLARAASEGAVVYCSVRIVGTAGCVREVASFSVRTTVSTSQLLLYSVVLPLLHHHDQHIFYNVL